MNIRTPVSILPLLAAGLMAGCSSGPPCGNAHPYAQSQSRPPLKAPPGLTLPAPDPAYRIPAAGTATAPTVTSVGPCMVTPPNVLAPGAATAQVVPAGQKPPAAAPAAASSPPPVAAGGPME